MMALIQNIDALRDVDVRTVDPDTLVEAGSVTVNTSLPRDERFLDYLSQIKNPYCFKRGKTIIKVSFADTDATLEDRLEKYLLSI